MKLVLQPSLSTNIFNNNGKIAELSAKWIHCEYATYSGDQSLGANLSAAYLLIRYSVIAPDSAMTSPSSSITGDLPSG